MTSALDIPWDDEMAQLFLDVVTDILGLAGRVIHRKGRRYERDGVNRIPYFMLDLNLSDADRWASLFRFIREITQTQNVEWCDQEGTGWANLAAAAFRDFIMGRPLPIRDIETAARYYSFVEAQRGKANRK